MNDVSDPNVYELALRYGVITDANCVENLIKAFPPHVAGITWAQKTNMPELVFKYGRILDLGSNWGLHYEKYHNKAVQEGVSIKNYKLQGELHRKKLSGTYIDLSCMYQTEFFHAIMDFGYKIYHCSRLGLFDSADGVLIPSNIMTNEIVNLFIDLIPNKLNKVFVEKNELIDIPNLIVVQRSFYDMAGYHDFLIDKFSLPVVTDPSLKLFAVRGDKTNNGARNLENTEQLEKISVEYGYEVIDFGSLPFASQIEISSACRSLISVHGGALTHMIFMSNVSNVLELLGARHHNGCFRMMAALREQKYAYLLDPRFDYEAALSDRYRDKSVSIIPTEFEQKLEKLAYL